MTGLGAAHLACGADFAFGHRRGGDIALLTRRAEALGMGLTVVPPITDAQGPISSTRIRRLLQDGYPERAAALLGRNHTIRGEVMHGDRAGGPSAFPPPIFRWARIWSRRAASMPSRRGCRTAAGEGVANIGLRPTVGGKESRLEAHLFDFSGDLYGAELTVALHAFLREEHKFANFDALRAQIASDADAARAAA